MAVEAAAYHQERLARHPDDYGPASRSLSRRASPAPPRSMPAPGAPGAASARRWTRSSTESTPCSCPATTRSAPDAATTGDPAFNSPWSYTGLPVVSFPVTARPRRPAAGGAVVGQHGQNRRLFETCPLVRTRGGPGHRPAAGDEVRQRRTAASGRGSRRMKRVGCPSACGARTTSPALLFRESPGDGQAKTLASASVSAGEERIEQVRPLLGAGPGPESSTWISTPSAVERNGERAPSPEPGPLRWRCAANSPGRFFTCSLSA